MRLTSNASSSDDLKMDGNRVSRFGEVHHERQHCRVTPLNTAVTPHAEPKTRRFQQKAPSAGPKPREIDQKAPFFERKAPRMDQKARHLPQKASKTEQITPPTEQISPNAARFTRTALFRSPSLSTTGDVLSATCDGSRTVPPRGLLGLFSKAGAHVVPSGRLAQPGNIRCGPLVPSAWHSGALCHGRGCDSELAPGRN